MNPSIRLPAIVAATSLVWCLTVGVWIWAQPVQSSSVGWIAGPAGTQFVERVEERSFSDISRFGIFPLMVPVALAAGATWLAFGQHVVGLWLVTAIFGGYCLVGAWSIGLAYLPAAAGLFLTSILRMEANAKRREQQGRSARQPAQP
jgi:hypothetical protein